MQVTKIGKVVCAWCGGEKQKVLEAINQCPNCGGLDQKVTLVSIGRPYDSRRAFAEDRRLAHPQ